jgi:ABC-type glycerol-3-phosphate transport system substrate-binding protein
MKNLKYVLIMFVALTATVACSDDNDSDGGDVNPIVGTWGLSESESGFEVSLSATFTENNKGTMVVTIGIGGESQTENSLFTWSTSGDQLTMVMDGETDVSTYSISGDKLTITDDDGAITVLTRE